MALHGEGCCGIPKKRVGKARKGREMEGKGREGKEKEGWQAGRKEARKKERTEGGREGRRKARLRITGLCRNLTSPRWRRRTITYLRILWNELNGKVINPRHVDVAASYVKGLLITDARNLYDKLRRATPTVKGAEKRSSI